MNRRAYLRAVAVAGAAAVAGCESMPKTGSGDDSNGGDAGGDDGTDPSGASDDGSGGTANDTDGGGESASGEDDAAAEHIRSAVGMLNRVGYRLSELEDQIESDPTQVELDVEETLAAVDQARSDLDAAAETATTDQQATIDTLRSLATVLAEMTRLIGLLSTVDTDARLESVQSEVEAGNYDAALAAIREANATAQQVDEHVTAATEAADSMDSDRLAATEAVSYEELEPPLTVAGRLVDGLLAVTTGYEEILLGREDLETAQTAIENQEYDAAESALFDGRTHFTTADDAFASVGDDAPASLGSHMDRADCQTDHLLLATDHFQIAVEESRDGNPAAAQTHREDAEAELQRVDEC